MEHTVSSSSFFRLLRATGKEHPFTPTAEGITRSVEFRDDTRPHSQEAAHFLATAREEGKNLKSNLSIQGLKTHPGIGSSLIAVSLLLLLSMLSETYKSKPAMQRSGKEHSRKRKWEIERPEERMNRMSFRNRKETSVTKAVFSQLFLLGAT